MAARRVRPPATDRFEALVAEILASPDELSTALDRHARAIAEVPPEVIARPRWRLAGMGSSRFAAMDVAAGLRAAGRDAAAELPSASGWTPAGANTLVVAISASGRTPEVLAVAERHRGRSFVLGLTSRPESPLASVVDALVPLVGKRPEVSGFATLSYRSTLAALILLGAQAEGGMQRLGLAAAVPGIEAVLAGRAAWLGDAATALDTGRAIHVVGDGARLGAVEQAARMLREAPRIEAIAYDTAEWLHVGLYTLFPGDPVLLLAGSPADDEAVTTIRARGGVIVSVGAGRSDTAVHVPLPDQALTEPAVRALVEPVVAELLAAELWRRTDARTVGETGR